MLSTMYLVDSSDFVTSATYVPDALKCYASWRMQRSIDRSEEVFGECPVCVISVAVLVAVV